MKLSEDAQKLLEVLPSAGRIVNQTAKNLTGWDSDRLRKAKFELRDKGLVEMKASFGGPFGRTSEAPKIESSDKILASNEFELYEPFKHWAIGEFLPNDFIKGRDLFEVIISGHKRPKESKRWEIPDLISISLKKYKFIPELDFQTISFELKPNSTAFDSYGVFEAISHSKFGNKTYYCFEYPKEDEFIDNSEYQRIEQEAKIHGIGLIQIWFKDDEKKFLDGKVILEAKDLKYEPSTLSSFIEKFFPEDIKNRMMQMTQSW
jgi:hypothetical protein